MKRSGFKKKSCKEILADKKQKKLQQKVKVKEKKIKYESVRTLEKRIWELCKQIVRKENKRTAQGDLICYTCGKIITDLADAHTSHWRKKSILSLRHKYDIRVLKVSCRKCNMYFDGNEAEYTLRLIRDYGTDYVLKLDEELKQGRNETWGAMDNRIFLQQLEKDYKQRLNC